MTNTVVFNLPQGSKPSLPSEPWPDAIPLTGELDPPADFSINSLPDELAKTIKAAAEIIQAPLSMAANSFLSAIELITQGHADVCIDGRSFPISEYRLSIAESGDRKDTIDGVALQPIYEYCNQQKDKYKLDLLDYNNAAAAFAAERGQVLKKAKGYEAKKGALKNLGEPPEIPLAPDRIIKDFTIEGVTKFLVEGHPSIGVYAPEGGQILGGHGFSNDYILRTVSGLNQLFDGKPIARVRSGDGNNFLINRRMCLHLMIQPALAPLLLSNRLLASQGFLWRLLLAWPESLAGTRLISEEEEIGIRENVATSQQLQNYRNRVRELLSIELPTKLGTRNELNPRIISPDNQSIKLWRAFYNDTERKQRRGELLHPIKGMASRIAEHAARQACSLALGDDLGCTSITADFMCSGIDLATFHLNETLRLCGVANIHPETQQAIELYQWLVARNKDKITLAEIYTYGPPALRDAQTARSTVNTLDSSHYMRPLNQKLEFNGKLLNESFEVRLGGI